MVTKVVLLSYDLRWISQVALVTKRQGFIWFLLNMLYVQSLIPIIIYVQSLIPIIIYVQSLIPIIIYTDDKSLLKFPNFNVILVNIIKQLITMYNSLKG